MSYTTPRLRKRKPIFNKETEEKIGSYRRDLLNQHDTFTMAYVGISLLASIFNVGQVLIPLLFLSDVVWMEYGNEYTSKTQMKKCYQINLICTSCLALASGFDKMDYPFKIHMLITIIPIFFISHRRNPKNTFLELLWVLGWLLLKIGASWIVAFQYMNIAGSNYSKWVSTMDNTPVTNPWTNPPVIIISIIAIISSLTDMVESFYVIVQDVKLI